MGVPKVVIDAKRAASAEVLPQVVVHPPKSEKKRRPVPVRVPVLCKALMEPE
jgi:hypothetical protein